MAGGATSCVVLFDGTPGEMWRHAAAWGHAALGALDGRYRILVTGTPLFAARHLPASAAGGEPQEPSCRILERLATRMSEEGIREGYIGVSCDPVDVADPTLAIEFHPDQMSVTGRDARAVGWVAETLAMDDGELAHKLWVSEEEMEFLERILAEGDGEPSGA